MWIGEGFILRCNTSFNGWIVDQAARAKAKVLPASLMQCQFCGSLAFEDVVATRIAGLRRRVVRVCVDVGVGGCVSSRRDPGLYLLCQVAMQLWRRPSPVTMQYVSNISCWDDWKEGLHDVHGAWYRGAIAAREHSTLRMGRKVWSVEGGSSASAAVSSSRKGKRQK